MDPAEELNSALAAQDEKLRELLKKAERDLTEIEETKANLEAAIDGIRGRLGYDSEHWTGGDSITLHLAMAQVLADSKGGPMKARAIADTIRELSLYTMRDGRPVDASQIHARTNNYPRLFKKDKEGISLRHQYEVVSHEIAGSAEGRRVEVRDPDTEETATLRVGVSYTVLAEKGQVDLDAIAIRRAWDLVGRGFFENGAVGDTILTSAGWT